MSRIKMKLREFFFEKDGEKEVLRSKRIKIVSALVIVTVLTIQALWPKDHTKHSKSSTQLLESDQGISQGQDNKISGKAKDLIDSHQDKYNSEQRNKSRSDKSLQVPANVNLSATQVLVRSDLGDSRKALPSGTNFIGQLLGGIDTRNQSQILKVLLPYGAKHRSGGSIPKNSILLGTVSYSGQGEKVFIQFNRVIFPEGQEFQIQAQALSSSDYSPGLVGVHHGNTDLRIAASVGLTMISAATDVLTTKNSIRAINQGEIQELTPEPTIKNAMLQGASKVTKQEAARQAGEVNQKQDYITVEAGNDLIVSLITPFTGKGF
jgi:hypothetical protein